MITTSDWNIVLKELGYKATAPKTRKPKPTKCRVCGANMVPHLARTSSLAPALLSVRPSRMARPSSKLFLVKAYFCAIVSSSK